LIVVGLAALLGQVLLDIARLTELSIDRVVAVEARLERSELLPFDGSESSQLRLQTATMSAETAATIASMSVDAAQAPVLDDLSERELDAVVGAAVWYAKYHERMITELADDRSALAVGSRDRYQQLYNGLAKLGVRLRRPEGIKPAP
jgi:hypothetical protein